ncbi:glycoside hydrolase family 65 protein [Gulosibacter molinativorax]|uniref:Glycoside hydrolase family 65 protein n=2 Tax=Gulosibacter molinativorax TaxID=256821 RepID=A0ABT7CAS0_9MICO|nr:glycoside hydrolase family 65 protein [Gulosibacter molinativorax]QUY63466.1 Alpha,alpha-trehalose phosphorylase [Gulosibacter molinativorax]
MESNGFPDSQGPWRSEPERNAPSSRNPLPGEELDRSMFPVDPWSIIETRFDPGILGRTESVFAVGNGYLGMRGNIDEGREASEHGTYVNGFHETWPIRHAEEAFGFARVGQTIVNIPDPKVIRVYVDDEPFILSTAEIVAYERRLDMSAGTITRDVTWRTASGKHVRIRSSRLVSFTERHLAILEYEVELLDADASIVISSQLLNRQDGVDEYRDQATTASAPAANGTSGGSGGFDPRKVEQLEGRILQPTLQRDEGTRLMLGYRTTNSGMSIVCAVDHRMSVGGEMTGHWRVSNDVKPDLAKRVYRVNGRANRPIKLTKYVSYHTARYAPSRELADRCTRTLDRALESSVFEHRNTQRRWLNDYWKSSDVVIHGQPDLQQAMRFDLFQLAQASARTDGLGIPAKGVTGSGYSGHYFWDSEIFVLPFLTYTQPTIARNALRFRYNMLDSARVRATELNERGALFPWRTINGLESSAYYAAGTAQYHIDADITYAMAQYISASGDTSFLVNGAFDVFVETARMWYDLGFWRETERATEAFHIHGVTGPDEYTTVVNDNLFTNVMAQENLYLAAEAVEILRDSYPAEFARAIERLSLSVEEVTSWRRAARHMFIPYDHNFRVHPQDASFLDKEVWDLGRTPDSQRPLLLHFHPLVIYRFQVIKQADVVLALLLRGDLFTAEEKRRDFEYYDVLTTADSSLSAAVQSIIAAEVGHIGLAEKYFRHTAFVDLADLHGNTDVGIHVASSGGLWMGAVFGFAGMRDHHGEITFDPRLPDGWEGIDFSLLLRDSRVGVELRPKSISFVLERGHSVNLSVRGEDVTVAPGIPTIVELEHQGPRQSQRLGMHTIHGWHRGDGTLLTASVPTVTGQMPAMGPIMVQDARAAEAQAGDPASFDDM